MIYILKIKNAKPFFKDCSEDGPRQCWWRLDKIFWKLYFSSLWQLPQLSWNDNLSCLFFEATQSITWHKNPFFTYCSTPIGQRTQNFLHMLTKASQVQIPGMVSTYQSVAERCPYILFGGFIVNFDGLSQTNGLKNKKETGEDWAHFMTCEKVWNHFIKSNIAIKLIR